MEQELERAARRTAINLMRLNEALEMAEAESYTLDRASNRWPKRWNRMIQLRNFYERWFTGHGNRIR